MILLFFSALTLARPPLPLGPEQGSPHRLVVKVREGEDPALSAQRLRKLLPAASLQPWFLDPPDPRPGRSDLALYFRIDSEDALPMVPFLQRQPWVEGVWRAPLPLPPPVDIPPTTENFRPLQLWLDPLPGLGFSEAVYWSGADGSGVMLGDVEYGFTEHEDLDALIGVGSTGESFRPYAWHGTAVLGMLFAGVNGYGVDGAAPGALPFLYYPGAEEEDYDPAGAILSALQQMLPGDVLLIEQQGYADGGYCPASIDPLVFDAITYAVDAGIVVIEPGGNGSQDLDGRNWNGWFDRELQDSGSIMVSGGSSPESGFQPRSWYPAGGSSYGERLDVQGWYTDIVTTANADNGAFLADLAVVGDDGRQGYSQSFSGTSGASPMVAAVAASMQGLALAQGQPPWEPRELRAVMVHSGTPQTGDTPIGPQPDLRRLLRTWGR